MSKQTDFQSQKRPELPPQPGPIYKSKTSFFSHLSLLTSRLQPLASHRFLPRYLPILLLQLLLYLKRHHGIVLELHPELGAALSDRAEG